VRPPQNTSARAGDHEQTPQAATNVLVTILRRDARSLRVAGARRLFDETVPLASEKAHHSERRVAETRRTATLTLTIQRLQNERLP
jgi:hypothetical protein